MIQELSLEDTILIEGGTEVTPYNIGYAVGNWVGHALVAWCTFFKK
jgi:hypothetical protein